MTKEQQIKELTVIPGVGKSIAGNMWNIGIKTVADLRGKQPEKLYEKLARYEGAPQDRCVLYTFRCAVYFAETEGSTRDTEKLKWWNWKDKK
jgi:Pathogenicity locus